MDEQEKDHAFGMSDSSREELSEPGITQILIFHPDCGKRPAPSPTRNWAEATADRQRAINLELERVQDDGATVKNIVLGTNNFVYAVVEYPMSEMSESQNRDHLLHTFVVRSDMGERNWQAEDEQHAREQHQDAFPDEPITWVRKLIR